MLTHANRWILAGAWALVGTAAAAGSWRISRIPARDPETERAMADVRKRMEKTDVEPPPPRKPDGCGPMLYVDAPPAPPHAGTLRPRFVVEVRPAPLKDVAVQPLVERPKAEASIDGAALTWTTAPRKLELGPYERGVNVKPAGLRIERSADGKTWTEVARLAADVAAWVDAGAAPRMSYAYRVILEPAANVVKAAEQGTSTAEALLPSGMRARLVGGDAKVAILRVETYNRKSRTWSGRDRTARPGDELWPGGWKLTGLKFTGFRLTAEAVVEDGRTLELRTQE